MVLLKFPNDGEAQAKVAASTAVAFTTLMADWRHYVHVICKKLWAGWIRLVWSSLLSAAVVLGLSMGCGQSLGPRQLSLIVFVQLAVLTLTKLAGSPQRRCFGASFLSFPQVSRCCCSATPLKGLCCFPGQENPSLEKKSSRHSIKSSEGLHGNRPQILQVMDSEEVMLPPGASMSVIGPLPQSSPNIKNLTALNSLLLMPVIYRMVAYAAGPDHVEIAQSGLLLVLLHFMYRRLSEMLMSDSNSAIQMPFLKIENDSSDSSSILERFWLSYFLGIQEKDKSTINTNATEDGKTSVGETKRVGKSGKK